MSKTFGLDVVIGASVLGAVTGFKSVLTQTNKLGSAIDKLNSKKVEILEDIDKKFRAQLEPIENELKKFYDKQKDIKLKIRVKDNELKEFDKKIKDTEKEIKKLEKEKIDLEKQFKKGKISATEFESKTKEIEKELTKLKNKKTGLDSKFQLINKKANLLKGSLDSVNRKIDKLKNKKLKLSEELEKAKEEAIKTNVELGKVSQKLEKLNKYKNIANAALAKREQFKSRLLDLYALGRSVIFPINKAIEFESAMADVKKVANLTDKETIKMGQALEKLSAKIPIAADGLAQIAAAGAQLGISKDKLIEFTNVVAKMSTAFDMSAEEAGESIAKLMNVYNLALNDVQKLGDVINYLSDNTAAKSRDLVNVLARIGGTSKMFGLSAKQAAALADAFLAMGKPPEVAATAINALLIKLQTADAQGKKFQDGLKALGLNAIDIKFAIKNDPQKAIMMVLDKIKNLDKQTQMNILSNLFGAEYADDIALLVSGLNNYKKALTLVNDKQGYNNSMQIEFENRSKTTANQLQLLRNSLNRIAIDLGSVVLPIINSFAKGISFVTNLIADVNNTFPIAGKIIGTVLIGLGGLALSASLAGYAFSFLVSGVANGLAAWTMLNENLTLANIKTKALTVWQTILSAKTKIATAVQWAWNAAMTANPLGLIVVAIGAVVAGVVWMYKKFDWFRSGVSAIWSGIKSIFVGVWDAIKEVFKAGWKFIKFIFSWSPVGLITNHWGEVKNFFSDFWERIKSGFNVMVTFISNIFSKPVETISGLWSSLANWFNGFWNNLKSGFNRGVNAITNIFLHPINTIQNLWNKLIGWIMDKVKWVASIGSKIKKFFGFGGDEEKKLTLKTVTEKVKPIVTTAAVSTTLATAQPTTLKPLQVQTVKPVTVPVSTQQVQSAKNTQTGPSTIVYNFNFGDIKLDVKDGKIENIEEFKEIIKQAIEEMNFEHKQRSLSDVV